MTTEQDRIAVWQTVTAEKIKAVRICMNTAEAEVRDLGWGLLAIEAARKALEDAVQILKQIEHEAL